MPSSFVSGMPKRIVYLHVRVEIRIWVRVGVGEAEFSWT
jgi:hypothetical protein